MNIVAIPLQRIHKLHMDIIEELKLHEKHTSQLNIHVEKGWASLQQNLDQMIQERDQAVQQQQKIKEVIEAT